VQRDFPDGAVQPAWRRFGSAGHHRYLRRSANRNCDDNHPGLWLRQPAQSGTITSCSGTASFSGGALVGYILDAATGTLPSPPSGGLLRLYPDSTTLLFSAVDTSGNVSVMVPRGTPGVPLLGQGTSANPSFAALNLGAGSGVVTGTLPNANLPSQVQWTSNDQTTSTASIAPQNAYVTDNGITPVTYTLPSSCNLGDRFRVVGNSSGGWKIAQGVSGQVIHFGSVNSTSGTSGYLSSTQQYDSVELINITACTDWVVFSATGNLTVN
jgi:hypothetical protein